MNKKDFIKKYNLKELSFADDINIDLAYATNNNFTHQKLYNTTSCLLRKGTAEKLLLANNELSKYGFKIKIWDAFRPLKVQEKMWALYPNENFISNPQKGKNNHCRASAVDITLCDLDNNDIQMPTKFDHFGEESHRNYYCHLSPQVRKNVTLLENVMISYGFTPLPTEWWHFDDNDNYDIIYESYK